jgi:hypothetical protein
MKMKFTSELEERAHRSGNGEPAWRRTDAKEAVRALTVSGRAILGGELWIVQKEKWTWGALPTAKGPTVFHWVCERKPGEPWTDYVDRSCSESLSAIDALPSEGEVDMPTESEIFYNLTWASEGEYLNLKATKRG